jgi:2-keto-4-pentenoate hydratase/2-oxohepta-3-ene-1,7-dioic acid hydratase in catechol pathway
MPGAAARMIARARWSAERRAPASAWSGRIARLRAVRKGIVLAARIRLAHAVGPHQPRTTKGRIMDESRREFIAMGATLAAGAILPGQVRAADAPGATAAQKLVATTDLRLATFSTSGDAALRTGVVLDDGRVVDLGREAKRKGMALVFDPGSMISLIAGSDAALKQVRTLAQDASADNPKLADVTLASPIPIPQRNIYAVGWNYLAHFEEGKALRDPNQKYPEHPVFFTKGQHCMNGPFSPIPYDPKVSTLIDWEGELAVIIGKRGRNISEASAMEYVFGFSVINDTTARDLQQTRHGGQWFKGKSLDGHGPMGPWIVTRGAIDHDNLKLQTRVNGVVRQDANTGQMFFKVPTILAELSMGLTLEPGDVIATGTPPGVGHGMKPPMYLKPGDVMETEIVGIGVIRNEIQGG